MRIRINAGRQVVDAAAQFAARVSGSHISFDAYWKAARSHWRGCDVFLYGDGTTNRHRSAHNRDEFSASYDQWGHFLNYVFTVDPTAVAGPYRGREEFDRKTNNRFRAIPGLIH